jgi:Multicopper oxidase
VGAFPFHCHILQHGDGGMMGTIPLQRERGLAGCLFYRVAVILQLVLGVLKHSRQIRSTPVVGTAAKRCPCAARASSSI